MEQNEIQQRLAGIELDSLKALALTITGIAFEEAEYGSAVNFSGIRSGPYTFSRRRDSLTIFAADSYYGPFAGKGAWKGGDRTLLSACRRVLKAAKVSLAEIASLRVLSEFGAVAERVSENEFRTKGPKLQNNIARATRSVAGLPVWSSYATVALTAKAAIGRVEIHWPAVAKHCEAEARILHALVERGFEAPPVHGAYAESIEAGILHSPAVGLYMDIFPAIRVVYASSEKEIGKKPVAYLDRHGRPVEMPRVLPAAPGVPPTGRKEPASEAY
jgi:hypothetical protein